MTDSAAFQLFPDGPPPPEEEQAPVPGVRTLRVTLASEVVPRRQRWLWADRIVAGGLTLLAGREGEGKSTIAVDIAARVTRGELDGEFKGEPRNVLIVHTEDARDTTIVPRLHAAGADIKRVGFVDAVTPDEYGEAESLIVFPGDAGRLADVVIEHEAALVVLDAATSLIDPRLDGDKDRHVRQGLESMARGIGEQTGAAVLGIVHFGKRESGDTGKLILGSIAWSQVARSVLAVAKDPDAGALVLSTTKSNLAAGGADSLSLRIVPRDVDGISVGGVDWIGTSDRDARDLLTSSNDDDQPERNAAQMWLKDYLEQEGKVPSVQVKKAAHAEGFAERTLKRASQALGVEVTHEGFPRRTYWASGAGPTASDWRLSGASQDTVGSRARERGPTGPTGPDQGKVVERKPLLLEHDPSSGASWASWATPTCTAQLGGPTAGPTAGAEGECP